jgi:hypothetical protein
MATAPSEPVPPELAKPCPRRSHRRLWVLVGILLVLLGIAIWVYFGPEDGGFGEAEYKQIQVGMTQRDVEKLLRCPAWDYSSSGTEPWDLGQPHYTIENGTVKIWINDHIWIEVGFGPDGKVVGKRSYAVYRPESQGLQLPRFIRVALQKIGL